MCGIFGYISKQTNATQVVLDGLKRLDYRGYDSWGIAARIETGELKIEKCVGEIGEINNSQLSTLNSQCAIGHTRWATNGAVTKKNAHPHYASDKSFVLAQNGIVENAEELKTQLQKKGYTFISETDTEVIVRLIEDKLKQTPDMQTAIRAAFLDLDGRNTIIVLTQAGDVFAARNGSPLVIGVDTKKSAIYFSSDTLSFAKHATKFLIIENGQMVHVNSVIASKSEAIPQSTQPNEIATLLPSLAMTVSDIASGKPLSYKLEKMTITNHVIDKAGFDHYMLKEIYDSPQVIRALLKQDTKKYAALAKAIKKAHRVYTIGSGTAGIAAAQMAYYLRCFAKVPAVSLIGADAKEYYDLFTPNDLIIAPSQSGETADVLEVLEIAQKKGVKIASLVNMQGSMMTRMSDFPFMADAGAEICVMSTKVFTAQIVWGYLVAQTVSGQADAARIQLKKLAASMQDYLNDKKNHTALKKLAKHLAKKKDIFLLGKSQNLQIVNEGMVKLIEGSYKHAHAIPAGDLKHYAITLMEKGVPVIVLLSEDDSKAEVLNAVREISARGAEVIGLSKSDEGFDYHISVPDTGETSALLKIIPLQLLAYYLALELGNNIDKPRNIAKSVTVK